ncbi:hypothetical protein [Belnapia rosea]|nr:hypothetical protein [Belnapia rosea]
MAAERTGAVAKALRTASGGRARQAETTRGRPGHFPGCLPAG